jgi:phosphoribosylanthranilate isomerase
MTESSSRPGPVPARAWIKICGITNPGDATDAIAAGADALGFNFCHRSRRYLDPLAAADWLGGLPSTVVKVAVLVNPSEEEAVRIANLPFIDRLQLHGTESSDFCCALSRRGIAFAKAWPAGDHGQRKSARDYGTRTIVLDSAAGEVLGGSGKTFDWVLAREWMEELPDDFEIILAGGLTPENVGEAVREVRPFGVDVTTGVEISPGRKDPSRVRAFIVAARAALA